MAAQMDSIEGLRQMLGRKHELLALPQTPQLLELLKTVKEDFEDRSKKFTASKAWKGVRTELRLVVGELWDMSEQAAEATLPKLQELHAIGDFCNDLMDRRAFIIIPGFGSVSAAASSIYCLLSLPIFGWLSALLRLFGYRAYSVPMRAQLGGISYEVLSAALFAFLSHRVLQLPAAAAAAAVAAAPEAKAIAALVAAAPLVKSVVAARATWHKDEVPQRQQDDAQLAEKLKAAKGMAPDGDEGSLASLARAMAGRLQQTLQPAAQQQQPAARQPDVHVHVA